MYLVSHLNIDGIQLIWCFAFCKFLAWSFLIISRCCALDSSNV